MEYFMWVRSARSLHILATFLSDILSLSRFWLGFSKSSHPAPICLNMPKENKKLSPGLCWCTFPGRSRTERSTRWSPPSTRTRTGRSATQSLEWVSADCCLKMIFWKRSFGTSAICLLFSYLQSQSISIWLHSLRLFRHVKYFTEVNLPKYLPDKKCKWLTFVKSDWKPSQCQPPGDVGPFSN